MEEDNDKKGGSFKLIWNTLMFIIYLGIAYLIVFTPRLLPYNYRADDPNTDDFLLIRIILGVGVTLYACFRGYRVLKDRK